MATPAYTVGGTPLYQAGGLLDQSRPVYRPQAGNAGLLDQPKMDNLIRNFAGGLLGGYQVGSTPDANGRYFSPIAPSDTYTTNPGDPSVVAPVAQTTPGSGLTNRDAIQMMYGEGDRSGNSGDWGTFLGRTLGGAFGSEMMGGGLDDPWDRDSDFWKKFMRNVETGLRGRPGTGEGQGGGGGGSGASGGEASGGAGNPGR